MRRWTEGDEAAFVKRLESELLKCERFQVGKVRVSAGSSIEIN